MKSLDELLAIAKLESPAAATQVAITGEDPVFPTPFRVGEAGAASIAAVGVAAARLWELRTGRGQSVKIGVRAAAAAMRSVRYLRIDGKTPADTWDPFSGYYPVKDGRWVSIHCNFANHRDAMLKVLGGAADRAAAEKASAQWDGLALEDAIHAAKGCAGLARTAEEWGRHPHASAVAIEPLLTIEKIGDSKPEVLKGARPLSGVRVLDLTRVLAGPTCARTLAEHGADVLKISGPHLPDSGSAEFDTGIGKLQAFLDLRAKDGTDTLRALLKDADVFSQSFRPGTLAARGFSPEEAAALRPGIVYVTLSAWGTTGPWKDRRGFDSIVQTVSGMALRQSGEAKPKLMPVSAIDYVSGYLMAYGAMVALARRATEGGSWLVRVSLARTGKWIVDRGVSQDVVRVKSELETAELDRLLMDSGRYRHLRPVVQLSETPPFWERPPAPLGSHPAAWPHSRL